jgi:uncharacterized membrane protein
MVAFFSSLERTLAAGLALLVVIVVLVGLVTGSFIRLDAAWWDFFFRWLHVISGVMWIGLLWYFNFVQTPMMPKIEPAEHRAAVTKYIAPTALFWFRYGALSTVITGLIVALMEPYGLRALLFTPGAVAIGIGMWLALIMAFNVWFIIWPNQQKVLGLVEASPEQKAAAGRAAGFASRINTMLSIAMLFCMVAQANGGL